MSNEEPRGLTLWVYRPANGGDFTLNGLTSTVNEVTVVGVCRDDATKVIEPMPKDARISAASDKAPAVHLVAKHFHGRKTWSIRPVNWTDGRWYMDGGNYADSSDTRWRDLTGIYGAIAVHDRQEESK